MALTISEWFGHAPEDASSGAQELRDDEKCPFIQKRCTKRFSDNTVSGVCSVSPPKATAPVITCPNRLYSNDYSLLSDVANLAFGSGHDVIHPDDREGMEHNGKKVVAFGKGYGKELKLPRVKGRGGYFVDWILARLDPNGELAEFIAVEVQTIDTTGTYRPHVEKLRRGEAAGVANAGLNWENVNKRILPQLIYKGNVLRREPLCAKGLFFVCPTQVYQHIYARLGGSLTSYPNLQPGSLTFLWYGLGDPVAEGLRTLKSAGKFTTTVDQVAWGFVAPANLPPERVYENAIREEL